MNESASGYQSVIVGYLAPTDGKHILLVGKVSPEEKDAAIVNAFEGPEADELWSKLMTASKLMSEGK